MPELDRHSAPTDVGPWVIAGVGTVRCAIPVRDVVETMRPLPTSPLAGSPAFVLGVAVVRGAPVPVVSVAAMLGVEGGIPRRYVSVRVGADRIVALAVDAVLGIDAVEAAAVPPLLSGVGDDHVQALGRLDRALLVVLASGRLLPEPVWAATAGTP